MSLHANHTHQHGAGCGHTAVRHDGHVDHLHDGHLHHSTPQGVEEHRIGVNDANPAACTSGHSCADHDAGHVHGPNCGHPAVPRGDHVDYLVNGHLHHQHAGHCDHHGALALA